MVDRPERRSVAMKTCDYDENYRDFLVETCHAKRVKSLQQPGYDLRPVFSRVSSKHLCGDISTEGHLTFYIRLE